MADDANQCRCFLLTRSTQPENRFGVFAQAILKTEGLAGFELVDVDSARWPVFRAGDLIVLTRCFLRKEERDALLQAVENGAGLVCFAPDWKFAEQLGWAPVKRVNHPGWVRPSEGLPGAGAAIQTHIPTALYDPGDDLDSYETLAHCVDSQWKETGHPAVVSQNLGAGRVTLFFYDLPKAVARLRFGDPELDSMLTTGIWRWVHSMDLFEGYLDPRVAHLPQAELHGQMLAAVLTRMASFPLARLWYFPDADSPSVAVMSSDDDWSTPEQFQDQVDSLARRGAHSTYYMVSTTKLPDETLRAYQAMGHTFGPHVDGQVHQGDYYFNFMDDVDEQTEQFRRRYGSASLSLQAHCAPWMGHMPWMDRFVRAGFRMKLNYLSHGDFFMKFLAGAGRPIKFVNNQGKVFDCWQQPVTTFDDASLVERISHEMDALMGEFDMHLYQAVTHHSVIGMLSHPVSFSTYSKPFIEAVWDRMLGARMPILSADEWCAFQDRRDSVSIRQSTNPDGQAVIDVAGLVAGIELPLMVPCGATSRPRGVSVDGQGAEVFVDWRLGSEYLFVRLLGNGKTIRVGID